MRWSSVPPGHLWPRVLVVFGGVWLFLVATLLLASPSAAVGAPEERLVQHGVPGGVVPFLANPNVAFVLLMVGVLGLFLELSHPGRLPLAWWARWPWRSFCWQPVSFPSIGLGCC
jgi:hypothetical protein